MNDDLLDIEQLGRLAAVLNIFKSEAVQLRILEALLAQRGGELPDSNKLAPLLRSRSRSKKGKRKPDQIDADPSTVGLTPGKAGAKVRKAAAGDGATASLKKLLETDFFSKPKTINDLIEYCKHNMARIFKANEFSGTLARLVRNGALTRKKNSDDQYEYTKK